MDFSLIDFDLIRRMTRDAMGPPAAKHSKSLFIEICLVLLGVKPAYLLDLFTADVVQLAALVMRFEGYVSERRSRQKCSVNFARGGSLQEVRTLQIGDDLVVVAETHFLKILSAPGRSPHSSNSLSSLTNDAMKGLANAPRRSPSPHSSNSLSLRNDAMKGLTNASRRSPSPHSSISSSLTSSFTNDDDAMEKTLFVDASAGRKSPTFLDDETKRNLIGWISRTLSKTTDIRNVDSKATDDQTNSKATDTKIFQSGNKSTAVQRLNLGDNDDDDDDDNYNNNNKDDNDLNVSACVPSLFGVLLGYPAVYFVRGGDNNCLGFVPLRLISVVCQIQSDFEYRCLSFSVPEHLFSDAILTSLRPFETRLRAVFRSVRIHVENVTRPSISL